MVAELENFARPTHVASITFLSTASDHKPSTLLETTANTTSPPVSLQFSEIPVTERKSEILVD